MYKIYPIYIILWLLKWVKKELLYTDKKASENINELNLGKNKNFNSSYCSLIDRSVILNPYWVSGFVDGDGAFLLYISTSKHGSLSFRPVLKITVHSSDSFILHEIKKFFKNAGHVRKKKNSNCYYYHVESWSDMKEIIIPHFEKYKLLSVNKRKSYYLMKSCVDYKYSNKDTVEERRKQLLRYKASFKRGLNPKLSEKYNNIVPIIFPEFPNSVINEINPHWIAGFVAADGSFGVHKNRVSYIYSFSISQDKIDEELLNVIKSYFNCGRVYIKTKTDVRDYAVTSLSDLNTKIIPFFKKYKICASKEMDFTHFCEIIDIANKKGFKKRWKKEDFDKVKSIRLKMNNSRRKIE